MLGASSLALSAAVASVPLSALAMFGIGLGWSLAYVAATAELAEGASISERGRLLGFADLISGLAGAGLTVVGGLALTTASLLTVSLGAAIVTGACAAWIVRAAPQAA